MKAMRPEDRPKAIGLAVGAVLVLGLIFYRVHSVLDAGGPAPEPTPGTSVAMNGPNSGGAPPAAVTQASAPPASSTKTAAATAASKLATNDKKPGTAGKATDNTITPIDVGPKNDPFASGAIHLTGAPVPMPKRIEKPGPTTPVQPMGELVPIDITLTGLITGGRPVAVLQVGKQNYVVAQGDTFGRGFKLLQAIGNHVVVSQGLMLQTIAMSSQ